MGRGKAGKAGQETQLKGAALATPGPPPVSRELGGCGIGSDWFGSKAGAPVPSSMWQTFPTTFRRESACGYRYRAARP